MFIRYDALLRWGELHGSSLHDLLRLELRFITRCVCVCVCLFFLYCLGLGSGFGVDVYTVETDTLGIEKVDTVDWRASGSEICLVCRLAGAEAIRAKAL